MVAHTGLLRFDHWIGCVRWQQCQLAKFGLTSEEQRTIVNMRKILFIAALTVVGLVWVVNPGKAQDKTPAKYEYAILKWDGPDRLFYNMPDRFEMVHVEKKGAKIPGDAQQEEWCLAYGANELAKEGWEPVNLDSRRIVFKRAK